MDNNQPSIILRRFEVGDAEACFNMRHEAFTKVFSQELSPQAVDVGANAYDFTEFGREIGGMETFVAVDGGQPVGFCTVRLVDETIAEIFCLYIKLDYIKQGIGTNLVRHVENWTVKQYPGISRLVLDTSVPLYNQRFWEKLGYSVIGRSVCIYPRGKVPAIRLEKNLRN